MKQVFVDLRLPPAQSTLKLGLQVRYWADWTLLTFRLINLDMYSNLPTVLVSFRLSESEIYIYLIVDILPRRF